MCRSKHTVTRMVNWKNKNKPNTTSKTVTITHHKSNHIPREIKHPKIKNKKPLDKHTHLTEWNPADGITIYTVFKIWTQRIKTQTQYPWSTHAQGHSSQWFFCWGPGTAFSENIIHTSLKISIWKTKNKGKMNQLLWWYFLLLRVLLLRLLIQPKDL